MSDVDEVEAFAKKYVTGTIKITAFQAREIERVVKVQLASRLINIYLHLKAWAFVIPAETPAGE